jgi:hypothetical protein
MPAYRCRAFDHRERARISKFTAERGMAIGGLEVPDIVVTVEAVAGIAAWWLTPTGSPPAGDQLGNNAGIPQWTTVDADARFRELAACMAARLNCCRGEQIGASPAAGRGRALSDGTGRA